MAEKVGRLFRVPGVTVTRQCLGNCVFCFVFASHGCLHTSGASYCHVLPVLRNKMGQQNPPGGSENEILHFSGFYSCNAPPAAGGNDGQSGQCAGGRESGSASHAEGRDPARAGYTSCVNSKLTPLPCSVVDKCTLFLCITIVQQLHEHSFPIKLD